MNWKPTRHQRGFSLIELITVIAVLLILMSIAVAFFISSKDNAKDAAAKSDVTNVYKSARVAWVDNEDYPDEAAMVSLLTASEPQFNFVTTPAAFNAAPPGGQKNVYVDVTTDPLEPSTGPSLTLCATSASGKVFCLRHNAGDFLVGNVTD